VYYNNKNNQVFDFFDNHGLRIKNKVLDFW
jgi:hypothetical protein